MKQLLNLFFILFSFPLTGFAAQLNCQQDVSSLGPDFSLSAEIADDYLKGQELLALNAVSATSSETVKKSIIVKDESYRPRTNKNRNRFKFVLDASNEIFDGTIHGMLLPKILTSDDILSTESESESESESGLESETESNEVLLRAYVISSTDSYHDGIMTYYPLVCRLKTQTPRE